MQSQKSPAARQTRFLTAFILVALMILAGQLGNLALRQQNVYNALAESEQTRTLPVLAPRGSIYDRNLKPLAINRPAFAVYVRYPFYNQADVITKLAGILGAQQAKIVARIDKQKDRPYEPVKVADSITTQQYTQILEQKQILPGVEVQVEPTRYYPQKDLAAHLIGYVSEINQDQLAQLESAGYLPGESVGQTGLEAFYESQLHGQPGYQQVQVNNLFEPLGVRDATQPVPGHDLVLTIDSGLQRIAERALDWQMYRLQTIPNAGDRHTYANAKAGAVVVMDVRTGAILAMASRPSFDLNLFVGGIGEKDWAALNSNSEHPLLNRAIQAAYQPGSTWKMMTGSSALAAGVTTPYEKVLSGYSYEPTGQKDWVVGGHGWVDLPNALRLSSDIYFYEMGRRLGIDRLVQYAQGFGFGKPTGIDLNGESGGFVPDQAYRDKNNWWLGQTTSAAIGQIFTVTPVQLARYASALANGGKLMRPYLVKTIQSQSGLVLDEIEPQQTGTLPVPPDAIEAVVQGMKLVNLPGGTSDFAIWPLPGIATAGKTGTAENPPKDDYGLFVGFAPVENPEIAVAVAIEQAGHGVSVSPVARSIFADYFHVTLPAADPARVPDNFEAGQ